MRTPVLGLAACLALAACGTPDGGTRATPAPVESPDPAAATLADEPATAPDTPKPPAKKPAVVAVAPAPAPSPPAEEKAAKDTDVAAKPIPTAPAEPVKPAPPPPPPPPTSSDILGLTGDEVTSLLGPPNLARRENRSEVWQYAENGCVLHVFMHGTSGTDARVDHLEATDMAGVRSNTDGCLADLAAKTAVLN